MADTPVKFVWPPRPVEVAPSASDRTSAVRKPDQPRPDDGGAVAPAARATRGVWSQIERVWLGRTRAPLAERMADAGWAADAPIAYCPRCASSAGPHEADDTGCSWCHERDVPWERTIRLGSYEGLLREMILEVKFTRWRRLGFELGRLLGRSLLDALEADGIPRDRVALVPVPMPFRRWMLTGIDHSLTVCRGVAASTGFPLLRVLSRRYRRSQLEIAPSKRFANIAGSFRVVGSAPPPGDRHPLIVVDDVRTTGATLTGACRALATWRGPGLPRPWAAVLGVTPSIVQTQRSSPPSARGAR